MKYEIGTLLQWVDDGAYGIITVYSSVNRTYEIHWLPRDGDEAFKVDVTESMMTSDIYRSEMKVLA
jgi:hypothetical protein